MRRLAITTVLVLATPLACVANSGPWQWVESPTSGSQSATGVEIPGLGLHFTTPQGMVVFEECHEDEHVRDESGAVSLLSCSTSKSPDVSMQIVASTTAKFPDDAAIVPLRDEYRAAGWTVAALGQDDDHHGKSGVYARLQTEGREALELRFFSRGVVYIARVEYPLPNELAIEQDWAAILAAFVVD